MISFSQKGNFLNTTKYFKKLTNVGRTMDFDKYGMEGVKALEAVTPVDTGKTAKSWYYKITRNNGIVKISFNNSNIQNGVPIAIILQYGHATRNGGWVEGVDYINPAIQPVFDKLAKSAWMEVKRNGQ